MMHFVSLRGFNPSFTLCSATWENMDLKRQRMKENMKKKTKTCLLQIFNPHTRVSLSVSCCSKYRPQSSEPQTDGLSVSTTADGSQPNVRKLCDSPPSVPQAHSHNLAYYDNIICQVCPNSPHVYSPYALFPSILLLLNFISFPFSLAYV